MAARGAGPPVKRVCLTGAESTGKSTVAPRLAARFGGTVVREYGRTWAEAHGTEFLAHDLRTIADGQITARLRVETARPRLIVEDTDIVMTSVWSEMLFGKPDPALQAIPATGDLYLYFAADTPWVDDGTRMFDGDDRQRFDALVVAELGRRGIDAVPVGGDWEARYRAAESAVAALLGDLSLVASR